MIYTHIQVEVSMTFSCLVFSLPFGAPDSSISLLKATQMPFFSTLVSRLFKPELCLISSLYSQPHPSQRHLVHCLAQNSCWVITVSGLNFIEITSEQSQYRSFCFLPKGWLFFYFFNFYFIFCFLGPHLQCKEVPGQGVQSELQLLAYATATATATLNLSCVCDLHHSSWQHQILDPLRKARD